MSSTSDFVAATLADLLLPFFRRPVEDVIIETLDQRQVPNRTDFKELRDLVNSLRGQLTGATAGVKKLADAMEELEDRVAALEERMDRPAAPAPASPAPEAPAPQAPAPAAKASRKRGPKAPA